MGKKQRRLNTDADADVLRKVIRSCFESQTDVGEALVAGALLEVASAVREHSGMMDDHLSTHREFVESLIERFVPEDDDPEQDSEDGQHEESQKSVEKK
jgi:hypothetical protein